MTTSMLLNNKDLDELFRAENSLKLDPVVEKMPQIKSLVSTRFRGIENERKTEQMLASTKMCTNGKVQPKVSKKCVKPSEKFEQSESNKNEENHYLANNRRVSFVKNICTLLESKMVVLNNNSNDLAQARVTANKNSSNERPMVQMTDVVNKFDTIGPESYSNAEQIVAGYNLENFLKSNNNMDKMNSRSCSRVSDLSFSTDDSIDSLEEINFGQINKNNNANNKPNKDDQVKLKSKADAEINNNNDKLEKPKREKLDKANKEPGERKKHERRKSESREEKETDIKAAESDNDTTDELAPRPMTLTSSEYQNSQNILLHPNSEKKMNENNEKTIGTSNSSMGCCSSDGGLRILEKLNKLVGAQTADKKNVWLSLIENTGDSVMSLLSLKDDNNQNFWISSFREQCKRLDELSEDLICDIEDKISKIEKK